MFGMKWRKEPGAFSAGSYDNENLKPVIKCSICNGEQVAGFINVHSGAFEDIHHKEVT